MKYKVNNRTVSREEFLSLPRRWSPDDGPPPNIESEHEPRPSNALGVLPHQRAAADEYYSKEGCPVKHDKWGRPMFTSRRQKIKYATISGFVFTDEVAGGRSRTPKVEDFA